MSRTKLTDRELPDYTRGEEIFNTVSHTLGGAFGIAAFVCCVYYSVAYSNKWGLIGGSIFGITMILLYTMSSIYHGLKVEMAKKVFQVIDHCTIFFLIAGTYTPLLLTGLRAKNPELAWGLFAFVWGMSAIGITLTAIDLNKFKVFSMVCYMGIGWSAIFAVKPMLESYPTALSMWVFGGGIAYTLGTVLYGFGKKVRYFHSVFHLFVLLGSVLHFIGILKYCIMV